MTVQAKAHAEKRLFISLLTRDISLADAFLDLFDNSINAALKASGLDNGDSNDYIRLFETDRKPEYQIDVNYSDKQVTVRDNCGGISADDARTTVFVFGAGDGTHQDDRLSVYGIGLKRAMFKLGKQIDMRSEHPNGGFKLDLPVAQWEADRNPEWTFEIDPLPPAPRGTTVLEVSDLYPGVAARLLDPSFETELDRRIRRAYSFFIDRIVRIRLNGKPVKREEAHISSNTASESFSVDNVSIAITAGIGTPTNGDRYEAERAGWNVYCNGRAVMFYDRTPLTGWGVDGLLPSFQPKHRPFVGIVFFTSDDPEKLPWTTTKLGVNPDNLIWQQAVQRMASVGRQVVRFLDARYSEEGTTITREEMADAFGAGSQVRPAVSYASQSFSPPKKKVSSLVSVQYKIDRKRMQAVKDAIGKSSMSNGEAGLHTFEYYEDAVGENG